MYSCTYIFMYFKNVCLKCKWKCSNIDKGHRSEMRYKISKSQRKKIKQGKPDQSKEKIKRL